MADKSSPGSTAGEGKDGAASKVRRRNRMITSCLECRRRKLKCDKQNPCANCNKFSRECMFLAPALDSVSQKKLNEIKEKMGSLERTLEEDVVRRNSKGKSRKDRRPSADLPGENSDTDPDQPVPEDEKALEATPLATEDAIYDDDINDDATELGFKVGKFRMTERLGGLFRPKIAEEMVFTLTGGDKTGREPELPLLDNGLENNNFLEPSPHFIPPGAGFPFGSMGSKRNLIDFLPTKAAGDSLIQSYFQNVHFINRVLHWPTFQVQYENFWTSVLSGIEPAASLQSLVFAVMFAAIASMKDMEVNNLFHTSKRSILVSFQSATEVSLSKAHFLRTTKLETLQAFVIYLLPMCIDEISRAHSVLVGSAVRLGECFGLHRDPADNYGMSPVECHVRRILWFQLCFLDLRTAEIQGPRPSIKREDYDTKLPLNIDDIELMTTRHPQDKQNRWTDMTLSRLRFECIEMQRVVWHDRVRLDKKKVSITYVLGKIESFRNAMEAKYKFLDTSITVQHYARLVLDILSLRMHIMILHKFHSSTGARIPDRLRQIILSSGTKLNESAVDLDRLPQFERYRWNNGVYQQWHIAFLLLIEIFQFPGRREADRIWAIADYVFAPDLSASRVQKARSILGAIRDRAQAYAKLRRVREPIVMKNRIPTELPTRPKGDQPGLIKDPKIHLDPASAAALSLSDSMTQQNLAPIPTWPVEQNSLSPGQYSDSQAFTPETVSTSWTMEGPATFYTAYPREKRFSNLDMPNGSPRQLAQSRIKNISSPGSSEGWGPYGPSSANAAWRMAPLSPRSQLTSEDSVSPPLMPANSALGLMSGQYIPEPSPPEMRTPPGIRHGSISSMASYDPVNVAGGEAGSAVPGQINDQPMLDIDWGEWDKLFPPETNSGNLDLPVMQLSMHRV